MIREMNEWELVAAYAKRDEKAFTTLVHTFFFWSIQPLSGRWEICIPAKRSRSRYSSFSLAKHPACPARFR